MLELYHVHTYRCRHAGDEREELYIEKAIEMGAKSITFTDHAPFAGNPFGNRMDIEELTEYVDTLKELKKHYQGIIDIKTGLEIEYLPNFESYYKWLKETGWFDVLMIGQHFYQCEDGSYSFLLDGQTRNEKEAAGIAHAITEGMKSGYFQVVAHPDRMFRRCKEWTSDMEKISLEVINTARECNITIEKNLSSMERKRQYWQEFWDLVPQDTKVITGIDAHSVKELEKALTYLSE